MATTQLTDRVKKLEAEKKQLKDQIKVLKAEVDRLTRFIKGGM